MHGMLFPASICVCLQDSSTSTVLACCPHDVTCKAHAEMPVQTAQLPGCDTLAVQHGR
jgi:hypothetical protein